MRFAKRKDPTSGRPGRLHNQRSAAGLVLGQQQDANASGTEFRTATRTRQARIRRLRCCCLLSAVRIVEILHSPIVITAEAFVPTRLTSVTRESGFRCTTLLSVLKEPEATPAANITLSVVKSATRARQAAKLRFVSASDRKKNQADPNADHRYSASDWWQIIKSLPSSSILRTTRGPVLAVMAWSSFLLAVHSVLCLTGYSWVAKALNDALPSSLPHSATVNAIGLLLVFKTTSAYQKFDEGRHIWEHILSISRNLTRLVFLFPEFTEERRLRILQFLAAYPYLLYRHVKPSYGGEGENAKRKTYKKSPTSFSRRLKTMLCGHRNGGSAAVDVRSTDRRVGGSYVNRHALPWSMFPDKTVRLLANSSNRPLWVCDRVAQEVVQVPYTDTYTSMERSVFLLYVSQLNDAVGECERIHRTTVPLNYARHSLRGLTFWLFTLPLSLMKSFGWWTTPVMGLVAWVMYGIYQIGYTIEDPFQSSLRLATLCDNIFSDVMCDERRATAFNVSMGETEEWKSLPL